jgi:hypothetical protein
MKLPSRRRLPGLTTREDRPFLETSPRPIPPHSNAMQARAHLRLIVSDAPPEEQDDAAQDRMSMVQPVRSSRLRLQWLRAHVGVVALWSASALLLSVAGMVALGWL